MYVLRILAKNLILPPAGLLLLAGAGLVVRRRAPRTGAAMIVGALVVLGALSTPACSQRLQRALDADPPLTAAHLDPAAGAIVVLAGDMRVAEEYDGDDVGPMTLQRVRFGARLHRMTGLPLLVTGGGARDDHDPPGVVMARVLEEEFGAPVRWVETDSRNTAENARYSAAILDRAGIDTIYLVTTAFHMPRSRVAFEALGLRVVAAPTDNAPPDRGFAVLDLVPTASALEESELALHEMLGRVWYALVRAVG
jgi:uncharacterized SAM-binding protein YcdF (DUF218 family)